MGEYRLSQRATDDLIAIAQYGDEHFGVAQSDRYRDQLKHRFSVLAEQPQHIPWLTIFDLAITAACVAHMRATTASTRRAWR